VKSKSLHGGGGKTFVVVFGAGDEVIAGLLNLTE
jgi:hypothetical protein